MKKWIGSCLVGMCLFAATSMTYAEGNFISPDELTIGMKGYAKTVVLGSEIESFDVEVIGFVDNGSDEPLVLIQTSGAVIDKTGGVVQGMSGSPVYLDGRLLGAIAYGYKFGDATKCMVTPIGDMTAMWDMPDPLNNPPSSAAKLKKKKEPAEESAADDAADAEDAVYADEVDTSVEVADEKEAYTEEETQIEEQDEDALSEEVAPLSTPLMVSGFSSAAFDRLRTELAPFHMVPYAANGKESRVTKRAIEPGSSIGAVLMRGDFTIGALGTVTYVEGDKMVAFGHPFVQSGNSNYFLTNSEIYTTIDSLESGFKIGATGAPIGLVNQDRSAGIAGVVGKFPRTIPMTINVHDRQSGTDKTYHIQTIHNEKLAPAFLTAALCNAIDKTIDRKGAGTASVDFAILARNMPGEVFERENMYYHAGDIVNGASEEFGVMIASLMNNRFQEIEVMNVTVDVDVDETRRTARILEAVADKKEAHPGETVNFKVTLRPYRGADIVEDVPYVVPMDHPGGKLGLIFRGGGIINTAMVAAVAKQKDTEMMKAVAERERKLSFGEILDELRRQDRNNDIIIEENIGQMLEMMGEAERMGIVMPLEEMENAMQPTGVDLLGVKQRMAEEAMRTVQKYPTLYVIDNQVEGSITVVRESK